VSRLKSFKDRDENSSFLQLPEIEGAEYMIALLNEAGFVLNTGMGATSLSWSEIESWLRCTQLELPVWEKTTLKEMSEVYAAELAKATDKNMAAPYTHLTEIEEVRKTVDSKLRSVFSSLKRKQTGEPEIQEQE
jgi:hypothetical protein